MMLTEAQQSPVSHVLNTMQQVLEQQTALSSVTFRSWLLMMKTLEQMHPPQYAPIPGFLERVSLHDQSYTPLANRRRVRGISPTALLLDLKGRTSRLERALPNEYLSSLEIYHQAIGIGENVTFPTSNEPPSVTTVLNTADHLLFIMFGLQMINNKGMISWDDN